MLTITITTRLLSYKSLKENQATRESTYNPRTYSINICSRRSTLSCVADINCCLTASICVCISVSILDFSSVSFSMLAVVFLFESTQRCRRSASCCTSFARISSSCNLMKSASYTQGNHLTR